LNCLKCGKLVEEDRKFCGRCGAPAPDAAHRRGGGEEPTFVPVRVNDVLEGKWRLERKLGEGGMGTVYLAHDLQLDRKVAVKILASSLSGDAELVARFEREARMTASLEHPNIVPVYAVGKLENRPFIVMKKLEGRTLAAHLRESGAHSGDELLALMRQLCAGLDFIHARGFIHRDIKSGNIFIGPDGLATILDFGILRTSENAEALTRTGMVMGTPQYMSPEQALGAKEIDHRADLYALAILLFECLTGTLPFEAESELSLIQMQAHAPAPDVIDRAPWVPRLVSDVVKRALSKRPEERYDSAGELLAALEDAYAGKLPAPVTGRPAPLQSPAFTAAPGSAAEMFTQPSLKRSSGRIKGASVPSRTPPSARPAALSGAHPGPDTSELERFARKGRAPLYIGGVAVVALLALASAFVRSRAAASSSKASAFNELVRSAAKATAAAEEDAGSAEASASPTTQDFDGGFGLVLAEAAESAGDENSDEDRPASEETKTRPVRRQGSLHRSGSHVPGSLNVITVHRGEPYWASVLVDGVDRGRTPLNLELPPGTHRVHLERAGFRPVDQQIKVASGRSRVMRIELHP